MFMQSYKVERKGIALMSINVVRVPYLFNGTYVILWNAFSLSELHDVCVCISRLHTKPTSTPQIADKNLYLLKLLW